MGFAVASTTYLHPAGLWPDRMICLFPVRERMPRCPLHRRDRLSGWPVYHETTLAHLRQRVANWH
eukprot:6198200-Pyramimonas_sp.AAC.1